MGKRIILSEKTDLRFVAIRRGGTLTDADHHSLGLWAAACAEHVLHHFEEARPGDERPRQAIEIARAWARGELSMRQAREAAFAGKAAGEASGAAKYAALSAAQAVAVSHVPSHYLGAAAYAIRAARAAAPDEEQEVAGRQECAWQREQLPQHLARLVLEDQDNRNSICWFAFEPVGEVVPADQTNT